MFVKFNLDHTAKLMRPRLVKKIEHNLTNAMSEMILFYILAFVCHNIVPQSLFSVVKYRN